MADIFDLAPIPRRPKPPAPNDKPGAQTFRVEAPGEPPTIITLPPPIAGLLSRLAAAMPEGLLGGDPRISHGVHDLRAAGVTIEKHRAQRKDGGQGWIAVYRLACSVEAHHG